MAKWKRQENYALSRSRALCYVSWCLDSPSRGIWSLTCSQYNFDAGGLALGADHRVFVRCEADKECFRVAEQAMVGHFAKSALDAGTDGELSGKVAEAAAKRPRLVFEMATADALWSPSKRLLLYQCMNRGVLSFLGSLWQDAKFAVSQRKRPVHSQDELYKSKM